MECDCDHCARQTEKRARLRRTVLDTFERQLDAIIAGRQGDDILVAWMFGTARFIVAADGCHVERAAEVAKWTRV